MIDTSKLKKTIMVKFSSFFIIMGMILFIPAGTFFYWEAWVFIVILGILMTYVIVHFIKRDPELLERRMRTKEKVKEQKIIRLFSIIYLVSFIIPGLDKRYGWSSVPIFIIILADIIITIGYLIFICVLKENSYASRIIEVEEEQKVITTGPYSYVRHPMYAGIILIYCFAPLALASYWAMFSSIIIIGTIIARILNEEKILSNELKGYKKYKMETKYRLIPWIW